MKRKKHRQHYADMGMIEAAFQLVFDIGKIALQSQKKSGGRRRSAAVGGGHTAKGKIISTTKWKGSQLFGYRQVTTRKKRIKTNVGNIDLDY